MSEAPKQGLDIRGFFAKKPEKKKPEAPKQAPAAPAEEAPKPAAKAQSPKAEVKQPAKAAKSPKVEVKAAKGDAAASATPAKEKPAATEKVPGSKKKAKEEPAAAPAKEKKRKVDEDEEAPPALSAKTEAEPPKKQAVDASSSGGCSSSSAVKVEASAPIKKDTESAPPPAASQPASEPSRPTKKEVKPISPNDFFAFGGKPAAAPKPTPPPASSASGGGSSADAGIKRRRDGEEGESVSAAADEAPAASGGSETSAGVRKTAKPTPSPFAVPMSVDSPAPSAGGAKREAPIVKTEGVKTETHPGLAVKVEAPPAAKAPKAAPSPASSQPAGGDSAPLPPPRKWYPGMSDSAPPNRGNKVLPVGKASCLTKGGKPLAFVITGTLDSLEREECEALVQKYGGRTVSAVSGKTDYLIRGMDDQGYPVESGKTKKAAEMKSCTIIDEDGLLDLIRASTPQPAAALAPKPEPSAAGGGSSSSAGAPLPPSLPALAKTEGAEALWAEKYRPTQMAHLVGNNDHVRRLLQWLSTWEGENAKLVASAGDKKDKGAPVWHKAALLSGPPGVGKTSTAKVLLAQAGYDIVELNASDVRSEKEIKRMASDMVSNTSIADFATAAGNRPHAAKNGRMAIIMDEVCPPYFPCRHVGCPPHHTSLMTRGMPSSPHFPWPRGMTSSPLVTLPSQPLTPSPHHTSLGATWQVDGMSTGDRGGMATLIKVIASSKMPIVAICNDRQSAKVKSLANHCLDLRFRRPATGEIKTALKRVVESEGYVGIDETILDKLVEACNADIRQMLNLLQIWRPKEGAAALTAQGVTQSLQSAFKDLDVGPFDIADKFFRPGFSMEQQLRHYFVDSSMTPLLVQENYVNVKPNIPPNCPPNRRAFYELTRLEKASEMICQADVVQKAIMSQQQWALAPLAGALGCYGPGVMMRGQGPGRVGFPGWLGKNSTATKRQRLLREASGHMAASVSASKHEVRSSYIPALRQRMLAPLKARGPEGAQDVLDALDEYNLSKDDFDALMEFELLVGGNAKAEISSVTTQAKSALTRLYNKRHTDTITRSKRPKGAGADKVVRFNEDGEEEDGGGDDGDDDDEQGDDDDDDFAPPAKAAASSSKAAGKQPMSKTKGKGKAKA